LPSNFRCCRIGPVVPESIPTHAYPNGDAASAEDDPVCSVRDAAQSADAVHWKGGQNRYFTQCERIQGRYEKSFPGVVIIQQMRVARAVSDRGTLLRESPNVRMLTFSSDNDKDNEPKPARMVGSELKHHLIAHYSLQVQWRIATEGIFCNKETGDNKLDEHVHDRCCEHAEVSAPPAEYSDVRSSIHQPWEGKMG
jgi:hypothetical protein